MNFTPGPWEARFAEYGGYDCMSAAWYISPAGRTFPNIATLECRTHDNDPLVEATARLAAAAPRLYKALRLVASQVLPDCGCSAEILEEIADALDQAEGKDTRLKP